MTDTAGLHLKANYDAPLTIEEVEALVQDRRARHQSHARISAVIYPILTVIGTLAAWEIGLLLKHGWVTTIEIVLGFLLSIVIGVPLALAIFMWPAFSRSVLPLLVSSQAMPKVAIAPLMLVWFGFGLLPKVLIAFLIAFFPIVISTVVGLASIEPEKSALPSIFGGLKISITLAVVGAVVGEFVGGDAGLGYLLMTANGSMDTPLLFAGLIALTVQGVVLYLLVEWAERLAIPRPMAAANAAVLGSA